MTDNDNMGTVQDSTDLPVGDRLLGRVMNQSGEPIDGMGPLEGAERAPRTHLTATTAHTDRSHTLLETGIKVIDLFAPLARGGTVRLSGPTGVGIMVTLGEITRQMVTRGNGCMVYIGWQERLLHVEDGVREWRAQGIDQLVATVIGQGTQQGAGRRSALEAGVTVAMHFAAAGREVLLALEESAFSEADVHRALAASASHEGAGRITRALLDIWWDGTPTHATDGAACDMHLAFDVARAKQQLYPAIDPLHSTSALIGTEAISETHRTVAERARALLARYRKLTPETDQTIIVRGQRLQRFLTQPYVVAESFTGLPGESVLLAQTIADVQEIIEGRYDALPEQAFGYVGGIAQVIEKARTPT